MARQDTKNLFERGGVYYLRYISDGREIRESLHTGDLQEAIRARDLRLSFRGRDDYKKFLQRELAGLCAEEAEERKAANQGIRLADAFGVFQNDADRPACKQKQMDNHRSNWRRFLEWLREKHPEIEYCRQVTKPIAKEWCADELQGVRAIGTYNKHHATMKLVFKWICANDDDMLNPFEHSHKRRETDIQGKQPFTDDELRRLFSYPDDEFCRLTAIGLYATLRFTSARNLDWNQYDGEYLTATHDKTGAPATVRVPDELKYWLDKVPEQDRKGAICPTFKNRTEGSASTLYQAILQRCGIQTQATMKGLNGTLRTVCVKGFHSLRHTAITRALQAGATISQVKRLAGHASERMQETYTHLGADDAGEAAGRIGRFW